MAIGQYVFDDCVTIRNDFLNPIFTSLYVQAQTQWDNKHVDDTFNADNILQLMFRGKRGHKQKILKGLKTQVPNGQAVIKCLKLFTTITEWIKSHK